MNKHDKEIFLLNVVYKGLPREDLIYIYKNYATLLA